MEFAMFCQCDRVSVLDSQFPRIAFVHLQMRSNYTTADILFPVEMAHGSILGYFKLGTVAI